MRSRQARLTGLGAVVLAGGLLAAGGGGFPAAQVDLSAGSAWLMSNSQGLATLLDGASGEVVGSVRVAAAGAGLRAVQDGASAYVIDEAQGAVVRVDGGTYERSNSVQFTGGPSDSLQVFAGGPTLHVVDGTRAVAAQAHPGTLQLRQAPVPLAARPGPGQSVVDDFGALWLVDAETGDLVRLAAGDGGELGERDVATSAVGKDSRLLMVQDRPVAVDPAASRVAQLGSGPGDVRDLRCRLDFRPDERLRFAASTGSARLYAAASDRGSVILADLDRSGGCLAAVSVGAPGDQLGTPVEDAGMLFVPNATTGRAAVVDLATSSQVADLEVVSPGAQLELLASGDAVFYNDPGSEKAGVIRLDGGQWRAEEVQKYDPERPGSNLLPAAESSRSAGEATAPEDVPQVTGPGVAVDSADSPAVTNMVSGPLPGALAGDPAAGGVPGLPGGLPPGGEPTPVVVPPPVDPPPPVEPGQVRLTVVVVGQGTVSADPDPHVPALFCDAPAGSCSYDYAPGTTVTLAGHAGDTWGGKWVGCPEAVSPTCTVTMDAAATVQLSFFDPDAGSEAPTTLILEPSPGGSITAPDAGGAASMCLPPAGCVYPATFPDPRQIVVTASPATHMSFAGWNGCADAGTTCTLSVASGSTTTISASFAAERRLNVVITRIGSGLGTVNVGGGKAGPQSCTDDCTVLFDDGGTASVTASNMGGGAIVWKGDCAGPCSLGMSADRSLEVEFHAPVIETPDNTPPAITLSGAGVTATGTSGGSATVGSPGGVTVTVTGSDSQSAVTSTAMGRSITWSCASADGETGVNRNAGGAMGPQQAGPSSSRSMTLRDDTPCGGSTPVFMGATFEFFAEATSEGGRATSRILVIRLTP